MTGLLSHRLTFLTIYLVIDIAYVIVSKDLYEKTVKKIQGSSFPRGRIMDAVLAYIVLAIGWYYIAAPSVGLWKGSGRPSWQAGAIAGFVYGLVLYGVYNFTLRAQFVNYGWQITLRDLAWGTSWCTLITALYAHFVV